MEVERYKMIYKNNKWRIKKCIVLFWWFGSFHWRTDRFWGNTRFRPRRCSASGSDKVLLNVCTVLLFKRRTWSIREVMLCRGVALHRILRAWGNVCNLFICERQMLSAQAGLGRFARKDQNGVKDRWHRYSRRSKHV